MRVQETCRCPAGALTADRFPARGTQTSVGSAGHLMTGQARMLVLKPPPMPQQVMAYANQTC